jgi:hypothetical protein
LQVEEYFQQVQKIIESYSIIQLTDISYNKRGSYEGFIRGGMEKGTGEKNRKNPSYPFNPRVSVF